MVFIPPPTYAHMTQSVSQTAAAVAPEGTVTRRLVLRCTSEIIRVCGWFHCEMEIRCEGIRIHGLFKVTFDREEGREGEYPIDIPEVAVECGRLRGFISLH